MTRHPLVSALGCYVLLAALLTGPALVGRASLAPDWRIDWDPLYRTGPPPAPEYMGDPSATVLDYPREMGVARGMHAGRFDLWNPLSGAGAPLWAENGGPFFPLKYVFYLAPSRQTYDLYLALRLVLAALGAYCLARFLGQTPRAALAAGAAFELSGALMAPLSYGQSSAVFMLPWVLLGSCAIASKRSLLAAAGAALALGMSASSGHPTLILMVFAAFTAATVGHMVVAWRQPRIVLSLAGLSVFAVVVGLALAAATLLPFAELVQLGVSYKQRAVYATTRTLYVSRGLAALPAALFASRALGTQPTVPNFYAVSPSLGTLGLFAAVGGLVAHRLPLALWAIAALGVALAFIPAITWLPGMSLVLPVYAWPLIALPATQAVGHGVQALTGPRAWRIGVLALGLCIASAVVMRPSLMSLPQWKQILSPKFAGRAQILGIGVMAGAFGVCVVLQRTRFAAAGLIALMLAEQLYTMVPITLRSASTVLSSPPSPALRFLQSRLSDGSGRMVGLPYWLAPPLTPMLFGVPDLRNITALTIRRYYHYMKAVSEKMGESVYQDVPTVRSPLLDLAAVRYFVFAVHVPERTLEALLRPPEPPPTDDPRFGLAYEDVRVRIYENRAALPRVRLVHRAISVPTETAAHEWVRALGQRSGTAGELGAADVVVVEPDHTGAEAPALNAGGSPLDTAQIVEQDDPDRLSIAVRLEQPGFLVIADTYYPGWKAWVDGKPTSVFPADLLFRAIYLPTGARMVELRYEPASFFYGVLISSGATLCCLLVVLRHYVARG